MILTDAVSGTHTLADLVVGSGGNVTGSGTNTFITEWTSGSTIGDSPLSINAGALDMGTLPITNVGLVDGVDVSTLGTGNVTGGGAPTRLAYWDGATSLGDTNIYFDVPMGRYGIGTTNPALMLHLHDGGGENGIQLSYTIGALYSNITSDIFGFLRLMPSGGRVGINDLTPTSALDVTGVIHSTGDMDTDQDVNAGNDVNVTNDLDVIDNADIHGTLTMGGAINMSTHYINALADPLLAQDAATKNYVDTIIGTPKYTVQVQAYPQVTTTDSQTLYWGSQQIAPSAISDRWRVYIPKSGTIKRVYIYSYAGIAGSNEDWSMYIRLNDTTDTLIQTLGVNTSNRIWSNSALGIAVVMGDYIEIKEVQPSWTTNPGEVTRSGVVYIE